MSLRSIAGQRFDGKRVICRFDYDVPLSDEGAIEDPNRINASFATIDYLLQAGVSEIIILAHIGRPKGVDPTLSLKSVAAYIAQKLHGNAEPAQETRGEFLAFRITDRISLIENVRFLAGEEENDPRLAQKYAALGDIFVFDAFASAHRAQTSTTGVAALLPSFAGLQLETEIRNLEVLKNNPPHPFVIIVGGAKIEDKLPIIQSLSNHADHFLIGGGVANTFLKAKGVDVKQSLVQDEFIDQAKTLLTELGDKIELPHFPI